MGIVEEVTSYEPVVVVEAEPFMTTKTFHSAAAPKEKDEYNTCLWKAYENEQVSPFCALDLREILIDVERMEQKLRMTHTLGFGIAFLSFLFSMYICIFSDDDEEEEDEEYLDNNVFEDGYEYQDLSEVEKKNSMAYVAV